MMWTPCGNPNDPKLQGKPREIFNSFLGDWMMGWLEFLGRVFREILEWKPFG